METMKPETKTDKKQPKPTNALAGELAAMEGIPVYELTFCVGMNNKPDLPVRDSNGGMGKLRARADREITYLLKIRAFRVVDRGHEQTVTFYIPDSWCAWQPLE